MLETGFLATARAIVERKIILMLITEHQPGNSVNVLVSVISIVPDVIENISQCLLLWCTAKQDVDRAAAALILRC